MRVFAQVNTLRFRVAALCLVVSSVVLAVLCAIILHVRDDQLRQDFDETLVGRAEVMAEAISIKGTHGLEPTTRRRARSKLNPFRFPGYYFQIRAEDGHIMDRSRNLRDKSLPLSEVAHATRRSGLPVLETLSGKMTDELLESPGKLRMVTLYQDEPDTGVFFLQVASSLTPVEHAMQTLRRLFLGIVPFGLAAVALASWLMASRSLAPIGEIARQARELTAARLDRRIEARAAKDEVAGMVTVINEMLDRLAAAFGSQERFIADVSHELKTPLSVLLGQAQVLLQQPREAKEYQRFVASVQDELRQLARLVDSLLVLSRAESGVPLKPMWVSVNDIVMDAVQACEPLAEQRGVRLIPSLALPTPEGVEAVVGGDPTLLRAMMENLIRNATRYSPVEAAVEIQVELRRDDVTVVVRDSGPGIPPEHLDRVFDRFFRVQRGDQQAPGAGLGLAIAREVAKLHQGSIRVSNRPEGGCEFVVRLLLDHATS